MRLTLRTLLAYLDDSLEPAQARLIGAKIAESGMAQDLVNRLREVTRRRRLLAPDVDGPGMGLDPNVVSEYLDSTLAPEDVADIERVFLESDIHLAEVAAVHQIMTLAIGEPIPISQRSRERMVALGPIARKTGAGFASPDKSSSEKPPADKHAAANEPVRAVVAVPATASADAASSNGKAALPAMPLSAESRVPEYLRSKPVWQRVLPWIVVLGLGAVFVGLLWTDPAFRSKLRGPAKPLSDETQVADAGRPESPAIAESAPAATTLKPGSTPNAASPNAVAPAKPKDGVGIDPLPPDEPGDPKQPKPANPKPPADDLAAIVPPPPPKPGAKPDPKAEPVEPPPANPPAAAAKAGPRMEYVTADGVLLNFDPVAKDWMTLPHRALVHVGDRIAAPEPFDAALNVEKGKLFATVVNGAVVDLLEPSPAAPLGFGIRHGRLLLQTKTPAGEPLPPDDAPGFPVALGAGNDLWRLEISSDTVCAVEIVAHEPESLEQNLGPNAWHGRIAVVSGSVVLTDAGGKQQTLAARTAKDLLPTTDPPGEATVVASADMPRWVELGASKQIPRHILAQYKKEFESTQGVSKFLPAVVDSQQPIVSELAAKGLAITGNYAALVKALASAPHKETRIAAIVGLRQWLGETPKNGALLIGELERNFPSGDDAIIYTLLWGFSPEDARDALKSSQLVDWLEHPQLGIRELAYFHLKNITKLNYNYDAQMPPAQRKLTANRFRTHLNKEGGVLLKTPK